MSGRRNIDGIFFREFLENQSSILQVVFDAFGDAIYVTDRHGRIRVANHRALQDSGYTLDEIKSLSIADIDPDYSLERAALMWESMTFNEPFTIECTHRRKNGDTYPVEVSINKIAALDDYFIVGVARDISQRQWVDSILRRIAKGLSRESGNSFFDTVTRFLVDELGADFALIGELDASRHRSQTLSVFNRDGKVDNFIYALRGTPCQNVVDGGVCIYSGNVQQLFPDDQILIDLGIASYIGSPLYSAKSEPIGVLAILFRDNVEQSELLYSLLEIIGGQVATEIERVNAQSYLNSERNFFEQVINSVNEPLLVIHSDCRVAFANEAAHQLQCDSQQAEYCYQLTHHFDSPCSDEDHPCPMEQVMTLRQPVSMIHRHDHGVEGERYIEFLAAPWFDSDGEMLGIIESHHDVTERIFMEMGLRARANTLDFQAHHDLLTGLPNRLALFDSLERSIYDLERTGRRFALLFIDLDRFKPINDNFGHRVGDAILKVIGLRLEEGIRQMDIVARLGGDEFAVLIRHLDKREQAMQVAEKIIRLVEQPVVVDNHPYNVGASVGIAYCPENGTDRDSLLEQADSAMYRAKSNGRGQYCVAESQAK